MTRKEAIEDIEKLEDRPMALDIALETMQGVDEVLKILEEYANEDKYECIEGDLTGWICAYDAIRIIKERIG